MKCIVLRKSKIALYGHPTCWDDSESDYVGRDNEIIRKKLSALYVCIAFTFCCLFNLLCLQSVSEDITFPVAASWIDRRHCDCDVLVSGLFHCVSQLMWIWRVRSGVKCCVYYYYCTYLNPLFLFRYGTHKYVGIMYRSRSFNFSVERVHSVEMEMNLQSSFSVFMLSLPHWRQLISSCSIESSFKYSIPNETLTLIGRLILHIIRL